MSAVDASILEKAQKWRSWHLTPGLTSSSTRVTQGAKGRGRAPEKKRGQVFTFCSMPHAPLVGVSPAHWGVSGGPWPCSSGPRHALPKPMLVCMTVAPGAFFRNRFLDCIWSEVRGSQEWEGRTGAGHVPPLLFRATVRISGSDVF